MLSRAAETMAPAFVGGPLPEICQKLRYAQPLRAAFGVAPRPDPRQRLSSARLRGDNEVMHGVVNYPSIDGMQGVRGSNPLSSTRHKRISHLRSERHLPENCQKRWPVAVRTLSMLSGLGGPRGPPRRPRPGHHRRVAAQTVGSAGSGRWQQSRLAGRPRLPPHLVGERPQGDERGQPLHVELDGGQRDEAGDRHGEQAADDERRQSWGQDAAVPDPRHEPERSDHEQDPAGGQGGDEPRHQGGLDRLGIAARLDRGQRRELHPAGSIVYRVLPMTMNGSPKPLHRSSPAARR